MFIRRLDRYAVLLSTACTALAHLAAPHQRLGGGRAVIRRLAAGLKKFDAGRRAFEEGKFEEALIAFQASHELLASPNTRLYMGRCSRALGKVGSAYTALHSAALSRRRTG